MNLPKLLEPLWGLLPLAVAYITYLVFFVYSKILKWTETPSPEALVFKIAKKVGRAKLVEAVDKKTRKWVLSEGFLARSLAKRLATGQPTEEDLTCDTLERYGTLQLLGYVPHINGNLVLSLHNSEEIYISGGAPTIHIYAGTCTIMVDGESKPTIFARDLSYLNLSAWGNSRCYVSAQETSISRIQARSNSHIKLRSYDFSGSTVFMLGSSTCEATSLDESNVLVRVQGSNQPDIQYSDNEVQVIQDRPQERSTKEEVAPLPEEITSPKEKVGSSKSSLDLLLED